ncbi:MAG TPA: DinB family protein [Candidatus Nitrosotenuis sp.]|nr:DinB family protein [Candidatus Nitrosotenuis sp.]
MAGPRPGAPLDFGKALLEAWAVNERMNQFLLENLSADAWRAAPPGGKGRTIAAIFAHIHNVRHMWLVVSAKGAKIPAKLERDTCTPKQVSAALAKSSEAISGLLAAALARPDGKVKDFRPDVVGMFGYMLSHEAHHRGQICMLARQTGHPLAQAAQFGLWEWGKLWRSLGFNR